MPKVLDLFCGAGGAAEGYSRAGFDVIGVDIAPQDNYPFEFYQENALFVLQELVEPGDFDLIHASPPCQGYSELNRVHKKEYPLLIEPVRVALQQLGTPYVIENVANAREYMNDPKQLCGSSFGLRVRRHRLFECSFELNVPLCDHKWQDEDKRYIVYEHGKWRRTGVAYVYGNGDRKAKEYWPEAMGMGSTWDDCWMKPTEMVEAIPPAYTEYIGKEFVCTSS